MNILTSRIVLSEEFSPVQAFFNVIPDDEFLNYLEKMLNGIGIDYNGIGCEVPNGDEDDKTAPKTGMTFYSDDREKWVSNEQVKGFYRMSIKSYCKNHPNDSSNAEKLLKIMDSILR